MKDIKETILSISNSDELEELENKLIEEYRNDLYNKLLKDKKVEEHLAKIFDIDKNLLQNILLINGSSPLDDFEGTE